MSGAPLLAELVELLDFDDELLDFDEELVDFDDELVAAVFFLSPESRVAKNAIPAMTTTAATTIAMSGPRLLPDPCGAGAGAGAGPPGAGAPPMGAGGGVPNGCTGCVGGTDSTGGVAPVRC